MLKHHIYLDYPDYYYESYKNNNEPLFLEFYASFSGSIVQQVMSCLCYGYILKPCGSFGWGFKVLSLNF